MDKSALVNGPFNPEQKLAPERDPLLKQLSVLCKNVRAYLDDAAKYQSPWQNYLPGVASEKDFDYVREDIELVKKTVADKSLSLNELREVKEKDDALIRRYRSARAAFEQLYDGKHAAAASIAAALHALEDIARFDPALDPVCTELRSAKVGVD